MKIKTVEFVLSATKPAHFPVELSADIAFAGRSNVGKSTLMNALLGRRKLVKTSSTPGKTRLVNFFRVNNNCYFVDLPGYGYAKVSKSERAKWKPMMERYLTGRPSLAAVVVLLDVRRGVTDLDLQLLLLLEQHNIFPLIVMTKADKLGHNKSRPQQAAAAKMLNLPTEDILLCSSTKKTGLEPIWDRIEQLIFPEGNPDAL
jgi:GTP-binding protein